MTPDNTALVHEVERLLKEALHPTEIIVLDESDEHVGHAGHGGKAHLFAGVTASCFEGVSLLKRHQMVYDLLKSLMHHRIHALRLETRAPTEKRS